MFLKFKKNNSNINLENEATSDLKQEQQALLTQLNDAKANGLEDEIKQLSTELKRIEEAIEAEKEEKLEMPGLFSFIREHWRDRDTAEEADSGEQPGFFGRLRNLYGDYQHVKVRHNANLATYETISQAAIMSKEFFILLLGANVIATFGLFQNSTAVIIGAMLIAPLMMPILGFALGTLWGDGDLIRNALLTLTTGSILALLVSALVTVIIPGVGLTPEILGRTNPNLYDIIIAIASGLVGAYAFVNPRIAGSISGVAIAVALMPPLCTVGICLGLGKLEQSLGALLLYITNLVGISMAASFVFWRLKVHPVQEENEATDRAKRKLKQASFVLLLIGIPLGFFTYNSFSLQKQKAAVRSLVTTSMPDARIMNFDIFKLGQQKTTELTIISPMQSDLGPEQMAQLSKSKRQLKKKLVGLLDSDPSSIKIYWIDSR